MKIVLIIALVLASLQANVKHFKNTKEAVNSFILALEEKDEKSLTQLLTSRYKEVVKVTGIDADDLKHFLNAYDKAHRYASFDGKSVYIEVGDKGWTFPIPLIKDKKGWFFDIDMGIENMITREIGRNELKIIEALRTNVSFEELQTREDLKAFSIFKDKNLIVALPIEYEKTAIMSFVVNENGNVYEADLKEKAYVFDKRFKQINENDWNQ